MAMTINTNVTAMTAQRYLGINNSASSSSLAKLSSGSRVPSAKDDAAALAVGTKLGAEVSALEQASQNASQAVSMLQIADGALSTVGDILVRMKSLATQASSGQLGNTERALLDQEFQELKSEVGRIADDTDFNGTSLLNGGDVVASYSELESGSLDAVGIGLSFNTSETADGDTFLVSYDYTDVTNTTGNDTGNLTVTNIATGESQTINIYDAVAAEMTLTATGSTDANGDATYDLDNAAAAVTDNDLSPGKSVDISFESLGVTLTLDDRFDLQGDFNAAPTVADTAGTNVTDLSNATAAYYTGSGVTTTELTALSSAATNGVVTLTFTDAGTAGTMDLVGDANFEFSADGENWGTAGADLAGLQDDDVIYVRTAGATSDAIFSVDVGDITTTGTTGGTDATLEVDLSGIFGVTESVSTTASFDFRVGTGVSATEDEITVSIDAVTTSALGIGTSDITTQTGAETAITAVTDAINTISSRRADLGASQSRLEFASASIAVSIENVSAAESGLMDVDVSQEMTEFTSKQVLLQAGISMLSQANQQPSLLLSLLQ